VDIDAQEVDLDVGRMLSFSNSTASLRCRPSLSCAKKLRKIEAFLRVRGGRRAARGGSALERVRERLAGNLVGKIRQIEMQF